MKCPVCHQSLAQAQIPAKNHQVAIQVETCAAKCGVWLDSGELTQARGLLQDIPTDLRGKVPGMVTDRNCPKCQDRSLLEIKYPRSKGGVKLDPLRVDQCPLCRGIWLDQGEFDQIS